MSKDTQAPLGSEGEPKEKQYQYRWCYEDQWSLDQQEIKRKKRKGAWTYALIMASVFALCFLMLAGALIWYGDGGAPTDEGDVLSTVEIAERSYPSTVLICAKTSDAYRHGTGFFVRADGYVATNYHILKDAVSIEVTST